jgi:hypothetical protein
MSELTTEAHTLKELLLGQDKDWWLDKLSEALVTNHGSGWDNDNAMTAEAIVQEVSERYGLEMPDGQNEIDTIDQLAFRAMGLDAEDEMYLAEVRARAQELGE